MRINKVKICNFKNYQGEIIFDLSKSITILHGDNGYGKSSFFDAIEWCLTNTIEHFDGTEKEIKRDIINEQVVSEDKNIYVSIEFGGNELKRSFKVVGGKIENTKTKLVLESGKSIIGNEKVDNYFKADHLKSTNNSGKYEQIIKRTYILSQNQITDFVTSETSNNRYKALVNIMGLNSILNKIDNYKGLLSEAKAEQQRFKVDLDQYQESIKSLEAAKNNFENNKIKEKNKQLGIIETKGNSEEVYNELQIKLIKDRENITSFLTHYKEVELSDSTNLKSQLKLKEIKKQQYIMKIQKRELLIKEIQNKIKYFEKERLNLHKYNILKESINRDKDSLTTMNLKEEDFDKLNIELSLFRNESLKLEYALSVKPIISINQKKIEEAIQENKDIAVKIASFKRWELKYQNILKKLKLATENNKNKIMIHLITNVKEIGNYVKVNKLEKCPVCSSHPEINLEQSIQNNVLILSDKLQEDTLFLEKSLKLINKIEEKEYYKSKENKLLSSKNIKNNLLIERLSLENQNYKSNKLYDTKLGGSSEKIMKEKMGNIEKEMGKLRKALGIIMDLNTKYKELKDTNNFFQMDDDFKIRNENDMEELLIRYKKTEQDTILRIKNNRMEKVIIENKLKKLNEINLIIKDIFPSIHLSKNLDELSLKAKESIIEIDSKSELLKEVLSLISIRKANENIEDQINIAKSKLNDLKNKMKELKKVINTIDGYIKSKTNKFGDETKDFFNQDTSSIQKYFRYLNPIPSNSKLRFEGIMEEIDIKIEFDSNNIKNQINRNAKNILSSGQLNVLAISIFLAINEEQKTNALDFVAIDDPIQNMDDVNQYSICDVLGNIKKQLIFSTHNLDFLKLFIKKNEHRKNDIQIYSFSSPYLNQDKVIHLLFD